MKLPKVKPPKPITRRKRIYTENNLNQETGEVTPRRWINVEEVSGENFVQLHINTLSDLIGLTDAQWRLLSSLTVYVEYNTNELFLNPLRKEELAKLTGLKYNTINQSVSRLVKKNLLIRKTNNTYQMNPLLFFKGSEIERAKYLELVIRYKICATC